MSWLHILVKDRGSTFIVILKTFLQGKFFCFSLWRGSTCKKMESVICCCKYYRSNVLRIALRHLQIPLICRSSHDLDASDKFGYRINQFYLCTHAYSVVMPIRCAPTLHNKINCYAGILRKLQIERSVLEKLENAPGFEMDFVLDYSHLSCHSVDYYLMSA